MFSNFAVALAIAAATAEATQWGGDFGSFGSKSQLHSRSAPAYHPRSSRYSSSYSPSYGHGSHAHGTSSHADSLTSWAAPSKTASAKYGGQGVNPAYPTRGSFTPSYKPNYAPSGSPHGSHAHDHEVYPDHSANFNRFEAETTPAEVPTHAPAYSKSYYGSSKPSYGHSKYGQSTYPAHQSYESHPNPSYNSHAYPSYNKHSTGSHYHPAAAIPVPVAATYDGTWWTPNQQYSPPLVKYVPSSLIPKEGLTATCQVFAATDSDGTFSTFKPILFTQQPHQAVKIDTNGITWGVELIDYVFEFKTSGETVGSVQDCAPEEDTTVFNPLKEEKNGVANPYADPRRGTIDKITTPVAALLTDFDYVQTDILQNLIGEDSLIGRTMFVKTEADPATAPGVFDVVVGCCQIAQAFNVDEAPVPDSIWLRPRVVASSGHSYNAYPSHNSYGNAHAYGNSHGSYGHH